MNQMLFIKETTKIHNSKYDYSGVIYVNKNTKVKIICPLHGEFEQLPKSHLNGRGCRKCANANRTISNSSFISTLKSIHGNKYDYSLVQYKNSYTKIQLICYTHGIINILPSTAIKTGCKKCNAERRGDILCNADSFVNSSVMVHGNKYDYSLVQYKNNYTKVKIICKEHGVFEQTPKGHLSGRGCKNCYLKVNQVCTFIEKANRIHDNKYDYSQVRYINSTHKVKIICDVHGVFEQRPDMHIQGQGCPTCNASKGELRIMKFLDAFNIEYIREHTYDDLLGNRGGLLRFDFYLPSLNICIEYNGIQHYEKIDFFDYKYDRNGFTTLVAHDKSKSEYCKSNGIELITIKYSQFTDIERILKEGI